MTVFTFKIGSRVEVMNPTSNFFGRRGTIVEYWTPIYSVEIEGYDSILGFGNAELKILPRTSAARYTQDEWNDLVNGYESRIDQLNEVLDEISNLDPTLDQNMLDVMNEIKTILDKRPVQP
jgi:hypothetical protein